MQPGMDSDFVVISLGLHNEGVPPTNRLGKVRRLDNEGGRGSLSI